MGQVLLSSQDQRKQPFPGRFFNSPQDIPMAWPLNYVHHRVRLQSGEDQEIDLVGSMGAKSGYARANG